MLSIRKIVDSYFSKRTFPYWCVLLLDSAILFLSGVFVYWCFNRGTALQLNFWPLTHLMLLCVGVHFIFFAIFRTYSEIIRYSSFNDLIRVAQAMGCSALAVIAVHFFTNKLPVSGVRPRPGAANPDCGSHRDWFDVAASRFYQMGL